MIKHPKNPVKGILCILLILCIGRLQAQSPLSLGLGLSSSIYLVDSYDPYPVPRNPVSPYAVVKFKRHEILAGPDLYMFKNSPAILGAQVDYRFHLRKGNKAFDPFVEANFQYARYRTGNRFPEPYNSSAQFAVLDGFLQKHQSFVNTYGIGLQATIKEILTFYSVFGAGYNYRQQTIVKNLSGNALPDGNFVSFTGYIRLGASFFFYRKK